MDIDFTIREIITVFCILVNQTVKSWKYLLSLLPHEVSSSRDVGETSQPHTLIETKGRDGSKAIGWSRGQVRQYVGAGLSRHVVCVFFS